MQKSPAAPPRLLSLADQEHVNWQPPAHVSLPLTHPNPTTGHSIEAPITSSVFKRSRAIQHSLALTAHLLIAPQCSKQHHQVTLFELYYILLQTIFVI